MRWGEGEIGRVKPWGQERMALARRETYTLGPGERRWTRVRKRGVQCWPVALEGLSLLRVAAGKDAWKQAAGVLQRRLCGPQELLWSPHVPVIRGLEVCCEVQELVYFEGKRELDGHESWPWTVVPGVLRSSTDNNGVHCGSPEWSRPCRKEGELNGSYVVWCQGCWKSVSLQNSALPQVGIYRSLNF